MASAATFLFWTGFCMFRLIAIVQSRYMSPELMLKINLTGCIASSAILFFSFNISLSFVGIFLFGSSLGNRKGKFFRPVFHIMLFLIWILANTFATAFSYAQTFVNVSGALASKFVIGAAVGWMTLPFLAGSLFDRYHRIVPLITLSAAVLNSILIFIIKIRGESRKSAGIWENFESLRIKSLKFSSVWFY